MARSGWRRPPSHQGPSLPPRCPPCGEQPARGPPKLPPGLKEPQQTDDQQTQGTTSTGRPNISGLAPHDRRSTAQKPGPSTFRPPAPAATSGHTLGAPAPPLLPGRGPNQPPVRPQQGDTDAPAKIFRSPGRHNARRPPRQAREPGGRAPTGPAGRTSPPGPALTSRGEAPQAADPGPATRTKEVTKGFGAPQRESSTRSAAPPEEMHKKGPKPGSLTE
ncbi:hypothetical protein NDU88_006968 [Pleurodeles waltl]|uniref:Uncharacterized protein n=1 Tax=Pleurodeles waltl TaxID=8319 RepID=A0AAV7PML2_PLEWA|nr:hypothetical protein NDU88_006968 [Pleurodeles waltl]